jgi:choline monooxygenase
LFKSHHLKNIDLYRTEVGDRFSMQKVKGDQDSDQSDRLAGNSVYAYLYPNMMINRYGSWMDTNIVVPKGTGVEILKEK